MRTLRRRAALPAAVLLALSVTGCSGDDEPGEDSSAASGTPASPAAVPITADGLPVGVKVGVIVSLASAGDSGSQWSRAAEGAEVAAYRLGLGGTPVDVVPADDKGTADGGVAAVEDLVAEGVSGIVLSSSGPHVNAAIAAADEAGVPVLLPYAPNPELPDGGAWLTGPTQTSLNDALIGAIGAAGASKPVLVDAGGGELADLTPATQLALPEGAPEQAAARLANQVSDLAADAQADSVVVTGPASQQAVVVRALQGASVSLPVFLTPDALSPVLAVDLVESDGSLASEMVTVGQAAGDAGALEPGAGGDALSAYFAGVRAAAGDASVEDFFDGQPFSGVAGDADTRSHDAVVALARAAAVAQSTDPADVAAALGNLEVGRGDGLAASTLDFTDQRALSADQVVTLQSTSQDPGVRPVAGSDDGPRLSWFAVPRA